MMDQSQVLKGEELRGRRRVDSEAGERKHAGAAPLIDRSLDVGRPHQVGLVGRASAALGDRDVIVRALDLVLGTIAAAARNKCQFIVQTRRVSFRLFWRVDLHTTGGNSRHT